MKDLLLVCMPFYELYRPSLALGTLKALLNTNGFSCDVIYPNIEFSSECGIDLYGYISSEFEFSLMLGEWVFKDVLYEEYNKDDRDYIEAVEKSWNYKATEAEEVLTMLNNMAKRFIDDLSQSPKFEEYKIIGFTSSFHQNISSLALAKKIKIMYPEKTIIFGGANCEGIMGYTLHKNFPFIDYVFTGESEISLLKLINILKENKTLTIDKTIGGIVFREKGRSILTGEPETVRKLDDLPVPDHSDFFNKMRNSVNLKDISTAIVFETSRGCWWGAKSQCLFCGLNGDKLHYRSKSPERAYREIHELSEQNKCTLFQAADNVINPDFFESLFPKLSYQEKGFQFFYEIRSGITKEQIAQLAQSGVFQIQPGIESFSDHLLGIMRKGVSALKNIQCLKWLSEYGLLPEWNIIVGFPGDTQDDYNQTLSIIPYLVHLKPPTSVGMMRLDRFSPYFKNSKEQGIKNIHPNYFYKFIYNMDDEQLRNIAYMFDFEMDSTVDYAAVLKSIQDAVNAWNKNKDNYRLEYIFSPKEIIITDTRFGEEMHYTMPIVEAMTYVYCDEGRTVREVAGYIGNAIKNKLDENVVKSFLDQLVSNKLMINIGSQYLSLAVRR